jgi:probable phosphoglycerate mutase
MELLLIRHGEPLKVVDASGPADPDLSERGLRQARLLAGFLSSEKIDAIYTSPMRRAFQTASPLADRLGVRAVVDDDLAEFDREASTYIPIEEMRAKRDERFLAMLRDDYSMWGVDMEQFRARVVAGVEAIVSAHRGDRVAAFCHGGVINAYLTHILGLSRHTFFAPDYTSVSRVGASRSGVRSVITLNEVAHLRGHRLLESPL